MKPAKWSHWTLEERKELAYYVKKGLDKKAKIQVACAVAAKKLGRTRAACEFQYQKYLKNNMDIYLAPVEVEQVDATPEPRKDWDIENTESKEAWIAEQGEAIAEPQEEAKVKVDWDSPQLPQPTIQVYSNYGEPETAEIVSLTSDLIVARARGLFFTIKL